MPRTAKIFVWMIGVLAVLVVALVIIVATFAGDYRGDLRLEPCQAHDQRKSVRCLGQALRYQRRSERSMAARTF